MFPQEVRKLIISPTLKLTGLYTEASDILVYGTGFGETQFKYLKQIKGEAKSPWQIEDPTHTDTKIWLTNRFNKTMLDRVTSACYMSVLPDHDALIWNWRYACLICRIIYWRAKPALPDPKDAEGLALYYKRFYNTYKGKADIGKMQQVFQDIIDGNI